LRNCASRCCASFASASRSWRASRTMSCIVTAAPAGANQPAARQAVTQTSTVRVQMERIRLALAAVDQLDVALGRLAVLGRLGRALEPLARLPGLLVAEQHDPEHEVGVGRVLELPLLQGALQRLARRRPVLAL